MAINYSIRARVVDVQTDKPNSTDRFLVDTNIFFRLAYSNSPYLNSGPQLYQPQPYERYLKAVKETGGVLVWCGLSLSELAHLIEKTEYDLAKEQKLTQVKTAKEYRYEDPAQWKRVVAEIADAWAEVTTLAEPLSPGLTIDEAMVTSAMSRMDQHGLGGYDMFLAEAVSRCGLTGIITDDGDFSTVHGLTVCTANANVLLTAKSQKRLLGKRAPTTAHAIGL